MQGCSNIIYEFVRRLAVPSLGTTVLVQLVTKFVFNIWRTRDVSKAVLWKVKV